MKALTRRDRVRVPGQRGSLARSAFADSLTSALPPSLPHRLALIDSDGNIIAVNSEWKALAKETGAPLNSVGPGTNYLEVCRQASIVCADSRTALRGIENVLKQRASSFAMDYRCPTPSGPACFHMEVVPIAYMGARAVVVHTDVTGTKLSNEQNIKLLQQFALRLINAQEEERQRISQEMHDDLGNRIALMALSIRHIIKQYSVDPNSTLSELHNIFQQIMDFSTVVRELSHGLHPLLLRHAGIKAGLKSLREKFEKTHGIRMHLVVAEELPHLSDEVTLCIFRIAQESLQNVVKHSGAERVTVILGCAHDRIRLAVSDKGRGFARPEAIQKGLGLQSMEARALSVGGRLTMNSSPGTGTEICLTVPFQKGASPITV